MTFITLKIGKNRSKKNSIRNNGVFCGPYGTIYELFHAGFEEVIATRL